MLVKWATCVLVINGLTPFHAKFSLGITATYCHFILSLNKHTSQVDEIRPCRWQGFVNLLSQLTNLTKSDNALVPYPTIHNSKQKCEHFCFHWQYNQVPMIIVTGLGCNSSQWHHIPLVVTQIISNWAVCSKASSDEENIKTRDNWPFARGIHQFSYVTRTTRTPAFWEYPPLPHDYPYYGFISDPMS